MKPQEVKPKAQTDWQKETPAGGFCHAGVWEFYMPRIASSFALSKLTTKSLPLTVVTGTMRSPEMASHSLRAVSSSSMLCSS